MSVDLPLVSVVVPVYNQERYVGKCLRSIIRQTHTRLEIIVVDDGSTDNSLKKVQRYADCDKRISVLSQVNGGVALARKNGYLRATGNWIVFVDSDDYLPADSIESLLSVACSKNVDIVCGDGRRKMGPVFKYMSTFPRNLGMRTITKPELFDSYYVSFFGINIFPVTVWGKIIRKSVIDRAMTDVDLFLTPPLHRAQDEAFSMQLLPFLSSYFCLEKPVYVYRFGGITTGNKYLTELLDFGDYRIGLLDTFGYEKGYSPLFIEYVNILLTYIQQGLEFNSWDTSEAAKWLDKELEDRYLVQRMKAFFMDKTEVPMKCRMVINHDVAGLVRLAESNLRRQWLRSSLRKVLIWASHL